jgi:hypothetical protein
VVLWNIITLFLTFERFLTIQLPKYVFIFFDFLL